MKGLTSPQLVHSVGPRTTTRVEPEGHLHWALCQVGARDHPPGAILVTEEAVAVAPSSKKRSEAMSWLWEHPNTKWVKRLLFKVAAQFQDIRSKQLSLFISVQLLSQLLTCHLQHFRL